MRAAKRFMGFALLPALSALASLVLLPLISNLAGPAAWVALGVGQSIGALISIPVGMAWPLIGGHEVARASPITRVGIYRASVHSRLLMLLAAMLLAVPATVLLTPEFKFESVLFMVGVATNGLTASWYYAGIGEPRWLVLNEGIVRLAVYASSIAALLAGGGLIAYAAALAIGGILTSVLNWFKIMGAGAFWVSGSLAEAKRVLRHHVEGIGSRVLQGAFTYGGSPLFAAMAAPQAAALYIGLDQVAKAAGNGLAFVPQVFIQSIGNASKSQRVRQSRRSMTAVIAVAALAAISWAVAGHFVVSVLFASQLSLNSAGNALLILAVCLTLVTKGYELLVLVPAGHSALVFRVSSFVSLLGLLALLVVASIGWGYGGLSVIAAAQAASLLMYYTLRRPRK